MSVVFAGVEFDRVTYDRDADVLYLNASDSEAFFWEETPEGHVVRYDCFRELIGVTLIGVQQRLDDGGTVDVTLPRCEQLGAEDLDAALA